MQMIGDSARSKEYVSLYFHIPFCKTKCPYCHFYVVQDKEQLKDELLNSLELEWNMRLCEIENRTIASIYFGGGTPSLFSPKRIEKVLDWVQKTKAFKQNVECTLEVNPENISYEELNAYYNAGINRISLGVQSFQNSELHILGRNHTTRDIYTVVEDCQKIGLTNVSIDLMYDVPNQTLKSWENTLHSLENLPITHLSLYNLTIEPHTAFARKEKVLQSCMPSQEESVELYTYAIQTLEKIGLKQYEISAFAKDIAFSKHNTGYWIGREFIGYGPSAFSFIHNKRKRNIANLKRYCTLVQDNKDPYDFEDSVMWEDRICELFALNLRLNEGVYFNQFEQTIGKVPASIFQALKKLEKINLVENSDQYSRLTHQGRLYYDAIASELI